MWKKRTWGTMVVVLGICLATQAGRAWGGQANQAELKLQAEVLRDSEKNATGVRLWWESQGSPPKGKDPLFTVQRRSPTERTYTVLATTGGIEHLDADKIVLAGGVFYYRVSDGSRFSRTVRVDTKKPAPPPVKPPLPPSNLRATEVSSSHVLLAWNASVGAIKYEIDRWTAEENKYSPLASTAALTLEDSKVSAGNKYQYRVRALDSSNRGSAWTAPLTVTTPIPPDTEAPTVPTDVNAQELEQGKVRLTWTASKDNVLVFKYEIQRSVDGGRSFPLGDGLTSTIFDDEDLPEQGTLAYQVRALDEMGNPSDWSKAAHVTLSDRTPPTAPANLTATPVSHSQIDLNWEAAGDNVGVTEYQVWRWVENGDLEKVGTTPVTVLRFSDINLGAETTYFYFVLARDESGNDSAQSNSVGVTTLGLPDLPPAAPQGLSATAVSGTQIRLAWNASPEENVVGYLIERQFGSEDWRQITKIEQRSATSFDDSGLAPDTRYWYRVFAFDKGSHVSDSGDAATAVTLSPPDRKLKPPENLRVTSVSGINVALEWDASTGAEGYEVYRSTQGNAKGFRKMRATEGLLVEDTKVSKGFTYWYKVRAYRSLVRSEWSKTLEVKAEDEADLSPGVPQNVTAEAIDHNRIKVSWTPPQDDDLSGYLIQRSSDGQTYLPLTDTDNSFFEDTNLAGERKYSYQVRARDTAGHLSDWSGPAHASVPEPPDTKAPESPGTLTATPISSSEIELTWIASTDNVGVDKYLIERWKGKDFRMVGSSATSPFSDRGLESNTEYRYRVLAQDAAHNRSGPSNEVGATTLAPSDTTPPQAPTKFEAETLSSSEIRLHWKAPEPGDLAYRIERNGDTLVTVHMTEHVDAGLSAETRYTYRIIAIDSAGNESSPAEASAETLMAEDKEPPGAPSNLAAVKVSAIQVKLTWKGSDAEVPAGYRLERSIDGGRTFSELASVSETEHLDSGLSAGAMYTYQVRAYDFAGNLSDPSNRVEVSIEIPRDGAAPTVPGALLAVAVSESRIDLAWIGSSDSGGSGLAGYAVERSMDGVTFFQIAVTASVRFSDRGLSPGTFNWYRVHAFDNSGNHSEPGNVAIAATQIVAPAVERAKEGDEEGGECSLGSCGLVGLDLILPLGLLWLVRRRRLRIGRK